MPGPRPKKQETAGNQMEFKLVHNNINVLELERSLKFYEEALGLKEVRRHEAADGSFIIVFLANKNSEHRIELTWLRDKKEPYNLGDNEIHIAFTTDDFDGSYARHKEMGCICYENTAMGLYFINDPDGYWIEIIPAK
jgi:lactoylglutathione lyase